MAKLPSTIRRGRLRDHPLSYVEAGSEGAPLVVVLHGFPDAPQTWAPVMKQLSADHHVVAPWMRGYAPSTLQGPFDAETLGNDVLCLVEELGDGVPVCLVGHDWGAAIAYSLLALHGDRFAAAVTLSVPHPLTIERHLGELPAQLRRSWYMAFFQLPVIAEQAVAHDGFAFVDRLWRDWSPGLAGREQAFTADVKRSLAASLPAPLEYYRSLRKKRSVDWYRNSLARPIGTPTLYMHGETDGCIGVELCERQEGFFAAEHAFLRVSGAGHFLQAEQPVLIAAEIERWFGAHTPTNGN